MATRSCTTRSAMVLLIVIFSFKGIGLDGSIDGGAADTSDDTSDEPEGEKK